MSEYKIHKSEAPQLMRGERVNSRCPREYTPDSGDGKVAIKHTARIAKVKNLLSDGQWHPRIVAVRVAGGASNYQTIAEIIFLAEDDRDNKCWVCIPSEKTPDEIPGFDYYRYYMSTYQPG